MLLSGTDNRRNHSDEVEELQLRAHTSIRDRQLEQMDDWDRALLSRMDFPYLKECPDIHIPTGRTQ